MKRFTVMTALFGISFLVVWMIFQASAVSSKTENPVTSGNEVIVPVTGSEARDVAPVYDATGQLVSDPTGTISNGHTSRDMKVAPVFDASGSVVSDPTGTLYNSTR